MSSIDQRDLHSDLAAEEPRPSDRLPGPVDLEGREIDDEYVADNHALMRYEPVLGAGPVRPQLG